MLVSPTFTLAPFNFTFGDGSSDPAMGPEQASILAYSPTCDNGSPSD